MKAKTSGLLLALFVSIAGNVVAQVTEISGQITDPSGALVVGAQVKARNLSTNEVHVATSDAQGRFVIAVPQGSYRVTAEAQGFASASQTTELTAAAKTLNFRLTVGSVQETVQVIEEAREELKLVPGGTSLVAFPEIRESLAHNLKDVLGFTPGVLAQPRFGADETQLSIRGSGLRNNFHHRGLNVLIDGVPSQEADGFSDFEALDLLATQRIEVWKGANALRFGGNSMGGALNFITHSGETAAPVALTVEGGGFGLFKAQLSSGLVRGPWSYYASASDTELDGYRDHSQQGRQRLYGNVVWKPNQLTQLRFDLLYANVAEKLPGSLTRAEFEADPRQANAVNVQGDWGRFYDYVRLGVGLTRQVKAGHEVGVHVFGQYRNMDHPIFQVIDQDARNFGGEVRYRFSGILAGKMMRFVAGFAPQFGDTGDRRFLNVNGQRSALATTFSTESRNYGFYFEDQVDLTSTFTVSLGGRVDSSQRRFNDTFPADGDRTDRRTYSAFSPKVGFLWRVAGDTQLFGNVSRSYEPPLQLELTSFGAPGFLPLAAQDAWQFEVGTRGQWGDRWNWDVAFFDAEINDEIINLNVQPFPGAPFTIPTYRNAPNTRHLGFELGTRTLLTQNLVRAGDRLSWRTAYTWSRFKFVDDPTYANNFLAGAPRHYVRGELRYDSRGFWVAPNLEWSPATYFVDSANTTRNDKYAVFNLKAGYDWEKLGLYLEATNLVDREYSGSVQVDNTLGRYIEPANGRALYGGIRWR
ncbi:MAG: TonB-dependent receptor, partial [Acidobacteriales bacterium]|nr:TonB-dependent receptor [Terriglobales bacterium]